MIKSFLIITDNFLSGSIKNIFEKIENKCKINNVTVDILKELKSFESNPLTCVTGCDTKFETNIKLRVKMMLGIFFVAIPLLVFSIVTYFLNIEYSYAFLLTFVVAILATSRTDELAKRYVTTRTI